MELAGQLFDFVAVLFLLLVLFLNFFVESLKVSHHAS